MSTNIVESDAFDAAVQEPVLGDRTYPTSVPAGMTSLANRTRWHENTLQATGGGVSEFKAEADLFAYNHQAYMQLPPTGRAEGIRGPLAILAGKVKWLRQRCWTGGSSPAGLSMTVPIVPMVGNDQLNAYYCVVNTDVLYWAQNVATAVELWWPLQGLPPMGTITGIQLQVSGNPGSHSALPANLPTFSLYRQTINTTTLVATASDSSATKAAYETLHALQNVGFVENIDPTAMYVFKLKGESGTNAVAFGLFAYRCQIAITA